MPGNPQDRPAASPIGVMSALLEAVNDVQEGKYQAAIHLMEMGVEHLKQLMIEDAKAAEAPLTFD